MNLTLLFSILFYLEILDKLADLNTNKNDEAEVKEATVCSINEYCQYCLNKSIESFRINFEESIRLCLNPVCSQLENLGCLSSIISVEVGGVNETFRYPDELKHFTVQQLDNYLDKNIGDLKFYQELNAIFEKLTTVKPTPPPQVNLESKKFTKICFSFNLIRLDLV